MRGRSASGREPRVVGACLLFVAAVFWGGSGEASAGPRWIDSLYSTEQGGAFAVCPAKGGGCTVAGYMQGTSSYRNDIFIAGLKSAGSIKWQKEIAAQNPTYDSLMAVSIKQTKDGGFIVLAHGDKPNGYDYEVYLLKLDANAKVLWQERMGGAGENYAGEVQQTADGGYILTGTTDYYNKYEFDVWVVKLDSTGVVSWQKKYGLTKRYETAKSIQQTADGGYILAGYMRNSSTYGYDGLIMKLDSAGAITWQSRIGGTKKYQYSEFDCVRQTKDSGYIAIGTTYAFGSGKSDAWLVKFDSAGAVLWQKAIGGSNKDEARSVEALKDGTCVVAGKFVAPQQQPDGWLFKIDTSGNILWQKATGGPAGEAYNGVQSAPDGGFFATGYSQSFGPGEANIFIVRYDKNGKISDTCTYNNDATAVSVVTTAIPANPGLVAVDTFVQPIVTTLTPVNAATTVTTQCVPAAGELAEEQEE